ncbi:hypothetical protein [Caulobacter sp. RHG1]|uniref:hypothetical protein n=1 Tax=Caulobacter sp. (strain RHG1) TaxID=2545762 RepID=UPI00155645DB|nr:hypothetical protein [Caulobacter sp. RHG1]NQE62258.1 hypothetical protein [Caulobacter sp. RHG1]
MIRTLAFALPMIMAASASQAETLTAHPQTAKRLALSPVPSTSPMSFAVAYAQAPIILPRGIAKTSVERSEGGVTGSAGVLCGLKPNADSSTIGAARGYDSDGRFVGAKLAFSF